MSKHKSAGLFGLGAAGCLAWIAVAFLINTLLVLLVWNTLRDGADDPVSVWLVFPDCHAERVVGQRVAGTRRTV